MKYIHIILKLLLISSSVFADQLITRTQMHMGTLVSVSLMSENKDEIQKSFDLIHDVEMSLSSYAPQADVYRLNHAESIDATHYTLEAIALSKRYYKESNGYFDITVGSITKNAYRFGEDEKVPDEKELDTTLLNINGINIQDTKITLKKGVFIDLGGMGKGYAVDTVAKYLKGKGISDGVIAASGDIRCLGVCKVEIQNPFGESIIGSFMTGSADTGVSTSGNYRRFVKSKEHNHLIDPKKKRSQKNFASITLVSKLPNSDLDAYATAAGVMPIEKALTFLKERPLEYILITNDKKVFFSDGLKELVFEFEFGSL